MTDRPPWLASLPLLLDSAQIDTDSDRLRAYTVDGRAPAAVVYPQTFDQVAALLQWAQEEQLAVLPRGHGTKVAFGNPPTRANLVLSTSRLDRITEYDAANLTFTGEAGVAIAQVSGVSAGHLQTLPLQYAFSRATLGGVIATNAYNPKRLAYGGVRDLLLGVRVALPSGEIAHFGGKVVKNVAGYDMCKLFLGALGAFGVILEATFKLYAAPERDETLLAAFPTLQGGADAATHLLGTQLLPSQVLLLNSAAAEQIVAQLPADIPAKGPVLLVNFEGMDETLERQLTEMSQVCRAQGASVVQVLSGDPQLQLRQRIEAATQYPMGNTISPPPQPSPLAGEGTASYSSPLRGEDTGGGKPALVLRLGTLPSRVPIVMEAIAQLLAPAPPQAMILGDCGVGLVRVSVRGLPLQPGEMTERLMKAVGEMSRLVAPEGGYAVVEGAPPALKETLDVWGGLPSAFGLLKALKARFDPAGILNPGRFIGRL